MSHEIENEFEFELNYIHTYIQEFNLRTHVMWVYFLSSPMLTVWLPLAVLKASTGYLSLSPFSFLFIYLF